MAPTVVQAAAALELGPQPPPETGAQLGWGAGGEHCAEILAVGGGGTWEGAGTAAGCARRTSQLEDKETGKISK